MEHIMIIWHKDGRVTTVEADSTVCLLNKYKELDQNNITKAQIWGGKIWEVKNEG